MVRFTPQYPLDRRSGRPQRAWTTWWGEKSWLPQGQEFRPLWPPSPQPVAITLALVQLLSSVRMNGRWTGMTRKKAIMAYSHGICLEGHRNNTKNLRHNSRCSDYKSGRMPLNRPASTSHNYLSLVGNMQCYNPQDRNIDCTPTLMFSWTTAKVFAQQQTDNVSPSCRESWL
jgi:hypothetical protein